MSFMTRLSCLLAIGAACSSSDSRTERYLPLQVTNAPTCSLGKTFGRPVVIRLEHGSDFVQQGLEDRMELASSWAGRNALVKIGLCSSTTQCHTVSWIGKIETRIVARDGKLHVTIPPLQVMCDGGSARAL